MALKTYGLSDILRAEELQREARRLHLPVFPVVTWGAKILDLKGNVIDEILGKSNSYVRNGLNLIASHGGYSYIYGTTYADGSFALKNPAGTVRSSAGLECITGSPQTATTGEANFSFQAGYGDTAESIDDYVLASPFASGSSVNQLILGTSLRDSQYVAATKKVVTTVSRLFTNGYASSQDIKEIGLQVKLTYNGGSELMLVMRDVLASSIALASGASIILYYQLSTLFDVG